jgi:hypothetical protein
MPASTLLGIHIGKSLQTGSLAMNERRSNPLGPGAAAGRFLAGVFGLISGGIGLTVIVFLWGSPWNEFGAPPLVFRVFGSFIALGFVATGGAMLFGAITGSAAISAMRSMQNGTSPSQCGEPNGEDGPGLGLGYTCPQCSAPLSTQADVSPHGDVKCSFCNCWFNVHSK